MAKEYSTASTDVEQRVKKLRANYHPELGDFNGKFKAVTLCLLFVFDDEGGQVLQHQGYPAAGVTRITSTRDRAAGLADAVIVIDRFTYEGLSAPQKDALLDHELHHLDRARDDNGDLVWDSNGRPKLSMRKHDHQIGAFDEILERHRGDAIEAVAAKRLIAATAQLSLPLEQDEAA